MAKEGEKKGFFGLLEEKYYDFLDQIEKIGLPIYKIVDPLEERNIPTFPLAVLLLLIIAAGIFLLIAPVFFPQGSELTIIVQDSAGIPIGNSSINVSLTSGEFLKTVSTDIGGSATITVLRGEELLIKVSKEPEFSVSSTTVLVVEEKQSVEVILQRKEAFFSKNIRLLKPGTSELVEKLVELHFACSSNTSFSDSQSTTNGDISLEVPSDCGSLQISPQGNFSTQQNSFDVTEQGTIELFLQEELIGSGDVLVTVKDSSGADLAGVTVNLLIQNTSTGLGTIYLSKDTSISGNVIFNDAPEGKYFITTYDPTGIFAEFDSSSTGDVKSIIVDSSISFAVALEKKVIGTIKLVVKDSASLNVIENAIVSLSKDSIPIATKETKSDGTVEFSVGEQVPYLVVIDKTGRLIESMEVTPREEAFNVLLDLATVSNSESLTVSVVDEFGSPVEDAQLSLRSAEDDSQIGSSLMTGISGIGVFERIKEGKFYVSALKPGFGEATSGTIELSLRQQNELQLTIEIGFGNIEVWVFDEKKKGIAGANVSLINFFTGEVIEQGITGADGVTTLSARADKTAFVVVTASDFLPYTTTPVNVGKDITQEVKADLKKEISTLSLEFAGLFVGEESVKEGTTPTLNSGQRYKAKFLLLVPSGSAFDEGGVHIRTGEAEENVTNIIEKDSLVISGATGAYNEILMGTSYSPSNGTATDALHYTTSDAKWVELYFNEPSFGAYEIIVDLTLRENARQGEVLDLWYRAFGKSGGYERFPRDEVLGSSESVAEKHALYAKAKNKKFSVGPTNLCFDDFCTSIVIENISEQIQTSVLDEFIADVSSKYRLKFSISSVSDEVFLGTELKVEENASAIEISNYEVLTVGGAKIEGEAVGSAFNAQIGNIRKDDIFSGSFDFEPKSDGLTTLNLALYSGSTDAKERIFEKEILLNIYPAQEMSVEIVPKIIVPFINNNAIVQVKDLEEETPISNALVTVKKNNKVIGQGHSNSEGLFPFKVSAPNAGSTISVLVEKRGYKPVEFEIKVTENILSTIPQEIRETLVVGEQPEKEISLTLMNLTQIPVVINSIEPSASFNELIDFDFENSIIGETLDVNGSVDADIVFSLTRKGEALSQPTTVSGSINLVVTNTDIAKSWQTTIPAEIRIGFGEEVDESDCLIFYPTEWSIFTSTNEVKTLSVNVQNNCRVNGQAISLGSLQGRVNLGSKNKVGDFKATIEMGGEISGFDEEANFASENSETIYFQDTKTVPLTTAFKELASSIPANSEATISIEFRPDKVLTAKQEISIDFKAAHSTEQGIEQVRNKVKINLNINDLAECIIISPKESMRLTTCPFNTGYDSFPNQFSGVQGYGGYPSAYGSGYGGSFGGGSGFGYEGYSSGNPNYPPFGSNYGLSGTGAPYGYGSGFGAGYFNNPNYRGFDPYQTQMSYGSGLPSYITQDQTYLQGGNRNYPQNYGSPNNQTYPYSNFSAPFYGGDLYSQSAGGNFNCGAGQLRIANNCTENIDVSFETTESLMVDKQSVSIETGKQQTVFVKPTYFTGVYPIGVSAKLSDSDELPQQIANISVGVENSLTQSYRDCISIDPPRKLKFQNFYGKPVVIDVKNSCYDLGVRLFRSNDTIFFPSEVLRSPTDIPGSGIHEMIENWALLDETIQIDSDGRTVQVQSFEIFKALKNYCNSAPNFPDPNTQNPFSVIGNLRYFFSQGYYSVESRSNMSVNFYTEYGKKRSISFSLILEDWWEALPFAERLVSYGDPSYSPEACINEGKSQLDLSTKYNGCIPEAELVRLEQKGYETGAGGANGLIKVSIPLSQTNNCQEYFARSGNPQTLPQPAGQIERRSYNPSYVDGRNVPIRTGSAQNYPNQQEKGGCGSVDTISELVPSSIEKNGLKIDISIKNGKEIQLRFDATEWRKLGKPQVNISETLYVTVNRVVPAKSDRVTIPLKLCIKKGGEPPLPDGRDIDPTKAKACSNGGKTGDVAFEGYGFDKLLFDWREKSIEANTCDTGENSYFCDATQFSIALNKKAKKIEEVVEGLDEDNCKLERAIECEKKDSKELFRFLGDTKTVSNNAVTANTYTFFINKQGEFIENTTVKEELAETFKKLKDEILGSDNTGFVISNTITLLNKIAENEKTLNGNTIVLLLKNESDRLGKMDTEGNLLYSEQIGDLGLSKSKDGMMLVMSFAEFKKFFENLNEATMVGAKSCEDDATGILRNCKINEATVKINEVDYYARGIYKDGTIITTEFLNDFISSIKDFKVGIRSREEMSEDEKRIVMENITDFGVEGYDNFFKFYSENIEFNSQLIEDGFSKDFLEDFVAEYGKGENDPKNFIVGDFEKWEFDLKEAKAGDYNTTLVFDWSNGANKPSISIEMELFEHLSEINNGHYAKNPLFFFPVDGSLGLEPDTTLDREGYGIKLKAGNFPPELLRFNHYSENEPKLDPFLRFTDISTAEYSNRFDPNYSGEFLKIKKDKVEFYPTDPIGVQVVLNKTTASDNLAGFLYSLHDGTNFVSSEQLLKWNFINDGITNTHSGTKFDELYQRDILCESGSDRFNGFVFPNGNKGKTILNTVIYAPTRYHPVTDSTLNINCIKDSASLSKFVDPAVGIGAKQLKQGETILNGSNKDRLMDTYTVKNFAEMINSELVCAKIENRELTFLWNEKEILKQLS